MAGVPAQVQATVKEGRGRPAAVVTGRPGGPWDRAETLGRCPRDGPADTTPSPLRSGRPATAVPLTLAPHSCAVTCPPRLDLASGTKCNGRRGDRPSPLTVQEPPTGGEAPWAEARLL